MPTFAFELADFVAAQDDFAFDLLRALVAENPDDNVCFSPFSIFTVLAMAAEGAAGKTALEMGMALRLPAQLRRTGGDANERPWDFEPVHRALAAVGRKTASLAAHDVSPAARTQEETDLRTANAIWCEEGHDCLRPYAQAIDRFYGAGAVIFADLGRNPEGARARINEWVRAATHDQIPEVAPPSSIDAETLMLLASAIYFRGPWEEPFQEEATRPGSFLLSDGTQSEARLMRGRLDCRYGAFHGSGQLFETPATLPLNSFVKGFGHGSSGPDADALFPAGRAYPDPPGIQIVRLGYKGGRFSMLVVLPRDPGGIGWIEESMSAGRLNEYLDQLQERPVDILLPTFCFDSNHDLARSLGALGMIRAFQRPTATIGADFSGISLAPAPQQAFFLKGLLHRAVIDVSEAGTEAAAVTAATMVMGPAPFIPTFRADHPFLFAIQDVRSGVILFLGRVADPTRQT